jgi:acyl carrier protein
MSLQQNISDAIFKAIDEVNAQLPPSARLEKKPGTVLFGREQGLDSLGLVNLIVALERHVETSVGKTVSLSNPEVILAADTPFASVASLEAYLASVLQKD